MPRIRSSCRSCHRMYRTLSLLELRLPAICRNWVSKTCNFGTSPRSIVTPAKSPCIHDLLHAYESGEAHALLMQSGSEWCERLASQMQSIVDIQMLTSMRRNSLLTQSRRKLFKFTSVDTKTSSVLCKQTHACMHAHVCTCQHRKEKLVVIDNVLLLTEYLSDLF